MIDVESPNRKYDIYIYHAHISYIYQNHLVVHTSVSEQIYIYIYIKNKCVECILVLFVYIHIYISSARKLQIKNIILLENHIYGA